MPSLVHASETLHIQLVGSLKLKVMLSLGCGGAKNPNKQTKSTQTEADSTPYSY